MNKNCFLRRFVCIFSLMVFAFLCSFLLLGTRHLFSGDETRVAGITMEMLFSSEKLVQHLNGDPFLEYPPLFNWIGAICLYLFSNAEFAVRFPSSLSLFLSVILIFLFARRMGYTLGKS